MQRVGQLEIFGDTIRVDLGDEREVRLHKPTDMAVDKIGMMVVDDESNTYTEINIDTLIGALKAMKLMSDRNKAQVREK